MYLTHFIAIFILLQWSGTKHAVSPKWAYTSCFSVYFYESRDDRENKLKYRIN